MADATSRPMNFGPQNTGNTVLDSVVNILCSRVIVVTDESIKALHASILEIAKKEPGGLKASYGTYLVPQ
jgi:hypothetical protein